MAKYAAHPSRVYLDEWDFSGSLTATGLDISQEAPVTTSFADAGPRRAKGNYEFTQSHSGIFEAADNGFDEQVHALINDGTDHYLTQVFGANAAGTIAYDSIVQLTAEPRSASIGGAVLLNFDTAGAGGLSRGVVLASKISTGAEIIAGQANDATGAGTSFRVIYRVLAFTGTDITMHIEDAATIDGVYADLAGLTATFTGAGVDSDTIIIATRGFKHVVTTTAAGYTSATILVTCGYIAGTYIAP